MFVRPADPDDALEVRRILDGAMLEPGAVEPRIDAGDVLVAGDRRGESTTADRAESGGDSSIPGKPSHDRERRLGALVLEPRERNAHVAAVAVRRRHRGRGIGTALVERALEREGRLTATFDDRVRPFYDALGFRVQSLDDGRYRGVATADDRIGDTVG
ncbi:GNAT family N-acetyltransferase [Natrarchaeobaculum sulfurireducens]|uniref:Acetyltransferase (GNAT) family n=1 Tax=Natrarchaeobaculum sulfurireducens TaxID=2044521 RepID=A0A346PJW8_9EURY|nr:GNAT family N-acetyltransferase [Natrarchaeobaculum sulfurireducens]AXR79813.1 Acetyltransferase (GNAT) family [Natrarchaeobaculum sulfurireducens]AXR83550.1 hypothetical protein AArcMg_3577 [Natrarchaeobaculum sulfurireducens]